MTTNHDSGCSVTGAGSPMVPSAVLAMTLAVIAARTRTRTERRLSARRQRRAS